MSKRHQRWWNIPENLEAIRAIRRCSWCGKRCPTDVHHLLAKGLGGNKPPGDSWINLVPVGASATLECPCHTKIHSEGSPGAKLGILIGIVAARVGASASDIMVGLRAMQLCTKDTTVKELEERNLLKWVKPMPKGYPNNGAAGGEDANLNVLTLPGMSLSIPF